MVGAACPTMAHAEGLLNPRLNTSVVNTFLEQLSRPLGAYEHAVLIWDAAGFHTSAALLLPANVSVVQLLAYCPVLGGVDLQVALREKRLLVAPVVCGLRRAGDRRNGGVAEFGARRSANPDGLRGAIPGPRYFRVGCALQACM